MVLHFTAVWFCHATRCGFHAPTPAGYWPVPRTRVWRVPFTPLPPPTRGCFDHAPTTPAARFYLLWTHHAPCHPITTTHTHIHLHTFTHTVYHHNMVPTVSCTLPHPTHPTPCHTPSPSHYHHPPDHTHTHLGPTLDPTVACYSPLPHTTHPSWFTHTHPHIPHTPFPTPHTYTLHLLV